MMNTLALDEDIIHVSVAKSGLPVLKVRGENGRWITLHSMIDPVKEAEQFARRQAPRNAEIPVILGLGMGYHLFAFLERFSGDALVVVEKERAVLEQFLSVFGEDERLDRPALVFVCEERAEDCVAAISGVQMKHALRSLQVIEHSPSVRAFPNFYAGLKSRIMSMGKIDIGSKLEYAKFKNKAVKVLILHSKYYLLPEIVNSLDSLGHRHRVVMVESGQDGEGSCRVLEEIIREIIDFKPDFVLTVNHLGFDREGILTDFFTDIRLPYASWYIDNPVFIMDVFKNQISDYLCVFLWDCDYLADLKAGGFENVVYLPLATDLHIFHPAKSGSKPRYVCDAGFVGSSWINSYQHCLGRIQADQDCIDLIDRLADRFLLSSEKDIEKINFNLNAADQRLYRYYLEKDKTEFLPAITWRATQKYRLCCIRELLPFNPRIHGDPGWKSFLNGSAVLLPELNYYEALPGFYRSCRINFNTTAQQMKTGINQRVFDVPATGSFLITDYQSQLERHFEPGKEAVCYKAPEEIGDLVSFYLKNETARNDIVRNARNRVVAEHTYRHRLQVMVSKMRQIYG